MVCVGRKSSVRLRALTALLPSSVLVLHLRPGFAHFDSACAASKLLDCRSNSLQGRVLRFCCDALQSLHDGPAQLCDEDETLSIHARVLGTYLQVHLHLPDCILL